MWASEYLNTAYIATYIDTEKKLTDNPCMKMS